MISVLCFIYLAIAIASIIAKPHNDTWRGDLYTACIGAIWPVALLYIGYGFLVDPDTVKESWNRVKKQNEKDGF